MLKKITLRFEYDGSPTGDSDKAAFKSAIDSEVATDSVLPEVTHGANTETSAADLTGDVLTATIFYIATNAGITDFNSFWSTVETEYAKSTVVKTGISSSGNKHDCYHDSAGGCRNFTYLS